MAMALLRGQLTLREYQGEPWKTSEVKAVMAKIELVIDPERDRAFNTQGILGVRLVAELNDGRTEEIIVQQPKGHPDAPLSDAELLEKMTWLVENCRASACAAAIARPLPSPLYHRGCCGAHRELQH
jgi:2-methylcitrate dehydratase PrpD